MSDQIDRRSVNATPCTRRGDCEADASHWPQTPCGRRNSPLCPSCGWPEPRATDENYGTPCPHGWRTATVADMKQFAAEKGLQTVLTITPPSTADSNTTHEGAN